MARSRNRGVGGGSGAGGAGRERARHGGSAGGGRRTPAHRASGLEVLERRVLMAANLLDTTFGGGTGVVTTNVSIEGETAAAVAVLSSGKIVAAGTARGGSAAASLDFALVRYTAGGVPDRSFGGGDGKVTLDLGGGDDGDDVANALAVLPNGKLLVAGSATTGTGTARGIDFALARFNPDGSLDRTFGGGAGFVTTPIGTGEDAGRAVLVTADGHILVAGSVRTVDADGNARRALAVIRYTAGGVVDRSFGGGDGVVTTDLDFSGDEAISALARGPGGTFYAAGVGDGRLFLARFKADGTADTTFDGDGVAVNNDRYFGSADSTAGLAVLPDGRVLTSATTGYEHSVAKFLPDGGRDPAFGDNGLATVYTGSGGDAAPIAVLPGGKIVLGVGSFGAARLLPDGSSDATFDGDDGVFYPDLTPALGPNRGWSQALALLPDGRAVLAGGITLNGPGVGGDDPRFGLVRLKNLQLTAAGDPDDQLSEAATVAVGGSRSGSIGNGTDVDMYQFVAAAGQRVAFDLDRAAGSTLDSVLRVFDAYGNELASNDDAPAPGEPAGTTESFVRAFFPSAGTYYVGVSGSANGSYSAARGTGDVAGSTGGYVLRLADVPLAADPDDQIAEAPALAVGAAPRAGAIDPDTDVDLVKFTVAAGQRVGIDVDVPAGSRLGAFLRLFDAAGNPLAADSGTPAPGETGGSEPYLAYTFAAAGTFYVGVSAEGNGGYDPVTGGGDVPASTGAYTLALADIPGGDGDDQIAEAPALAVGTRAGTISPATDVDLYKFTLARGQVASLDIDHPADSSLDAVLRVFDGKGNEVAYSYNDPAPGEDGSVDPYIEFGTAAGGTFYVGVSGEPNTSYDPVTGGGDSSGSKGAYTLNFAVGTATADPDDQLAEAHALAPGTVTPGTIDPVRDVDMYRFAVAAGEGVQVDLNQLGVDAYLRLFDAAGRELNSSDGGLNFQFDAAGTYYLGVSSYGNSGYDPVTGTGDTEGYDGTGDYELTLRRFGNPNDGDDQIAEAKSLGASAAAAVDPAGDVDLYKFTVAANEEVAFLATSSATFNPALRLFDAAGNPLDARAFPALLDHRFTTAGTYYVGVSGVGNSDYNPVTGGVDNPFSETGAYQLTVTRLPNDPDDQIAEARPLALGVPAAGTTGASTDADLFSFAATAGKAVSVDLDRAAVGGLADGILRVFDADGNELASNQGGRAPGEPANREAYLEFLPSATGTYYVGVSGSSNRYYDPRAGTYDAGGGTTGTYTLTVALVPNDPDDQFAEATAVPLGSTRTAAIATPSDVDLYKFTVATGQRVALDLDRTAGSGLDAVLRVFDGSGNELIRSDDDPAPGEPATTEPYLEFIVRTGGTFYVGVSSHDNTGYDPQSGFGDAGGNTSGGYALRFLSLS